MFSERKEDPKKAILRDIYVDNLQIEGKRKQAARAPEPAQTSRSYPVFQIIVVLLILASSSFFIYRGNYNETDDAVQAQPVASAGTKMKTDVQKVTTAAAGNLSQTKQKDETLLDQIPYLAEIEPMEMSPQDYDLMLSPNDQVRLTALFGLGIKTVVIDPGHGGRDPGAIGENGTQEKHITLDVALELKKRLDKLNYFKVLLTRKNDRTLSLASRVKFAKKHQADLFISLHVNSLPVKNVNLIETYYFGAPLNSETLLLAEKENKDSHFSVGELDAIIQDIGNTVKRQESAMLAATIQKSLFRNLRAQDAEMRDSGIKMAPFVVLSQIEVPSVLVEISCITKAEEEKKLATAKYRKKVASYLEEGIVTYLETQHLKIARGEKSYE